MNDKKSNLIIDKYDQLVEIKPPIMRATELITGKNFWLIKIRWIYTFFILIFFLIYNHLTGISYIKYWNLALILLLSILGNAIFIWALKRGLKFPSAKKDLSLYTSMASYQLDFDLVVLSLLVFFSKGFDSPILVLFIFYIMIATFLIHYNKAIKNTVTAIILVVIIFFSNEGIIFSSKKLTVMIAFNIILLFTYFISAFLSKNLQKNERKLQELLKKTQELSVTNGLTDLYNQTYFFLLFRLQLEKAKRYQTQFSIIIFDVDHFKNYNDNNGHLQGSEVLRQIGKLMKKAFRSSDVLAKFGGDEFVIILPNSDKVGTFLAADRLREMVEMEPFPGREKQPQGMISISLGISSYPEHGDTEETILNNADKALYYAKNTGRNKTIIYNEDIESDID